MEEQKPIKKMNKLELRQIVEETAEQVGTISSFFKEEFEKCQQSIAEAQIEKKLQEINDAYDKICVDDGEKKSIKTQLGEAKNLFEEINDFHQKQKEKYQDLYKKIEEELEAGTTSVNLSKTFADKVKEYRWNGWLWSGCFMVLLAGLVIYYGFVTFTATEIKTTEDVWRHLAFRAPFLLFCVWLAIFFGNRRAESKKLEELYKHKEVAARSFIGYKQTIEELGDEDKTLLKQHMDNLLKAISENSATFLSTEGDKHPIFEALCSLFGAKKNSVSKE